MTLGEAIDLLYTTRAARLTLARELKDMTTTEKEAKFTVLKLLEEAGLQKASGEIATAGILVDDVPFIKDWNEVYAFIREQNRFDLLQKRIGVVAWRDMYKEGILVPGTEAVIDTDLSLTKSTRS